MARVTRHADSWHVRGQLKTGTRVYDVHDERHEGRIDAVLNLNTYRVTFDNGLRADIPKRRIRRVDPPVRSTYTP